MASGTTETDIDRDADAVWAIVREFGGLETWMPGIDACEIDGDDRVLSTMGITVRERLVARDDEQRSITYSITESPMNLEHHEAAIKVDPAGAGSHVTYTVEVRPDQMLDLLVQTYGQALAALKQRAESA
jgi:carbon monoxide dehydrogenase subunit G